jgi:hypothetical protein
VKASRSQGEGSEEVDRSLPGTIATPRRSAAWANPLVSVLPGRLAQMVTPPAGGITVQPGRWAVIAAMIASYRSLVQPAR